MGKGMTKIQKETERHINVAAVSAQTQGAVVQINEHLSRMNNRLYRQCMDYDVAVDLNVGLLDDTSVFKYSFFTLPNTWFVKGAIKYAFDTYMQSHEDEIKAGVKFGKYHDFKINYNDQDGNWADTVPRLFDGNGYHTVERDVNPPLGSEITLSDGSSIRGFNLMGNETNFFNIFTEYANLLRYRQPTDVSVSSSQPYDGLLDLKDADLMAEVGDEAPYDRRFSGWLHDGTDDQPILVHVDSLTHDASNAGGRRSTRTFTAPLGLIWIQKRVGDSNNAISTSTPELTFRVPMGDYKGVRAYKLNV